MKNYLIPFLFLLPLLSGAQTPSFVTDSLDTYIRQGMKDWNIPGLAIVIVKNGQPVLMIGYGVKDIASGAPVTENTLFMIASNTKLFTATSLALLEYRKKLSLNDRITQYFPQYRLYDPHTTALVTIKDLLTHRIGTKTFQGDFTFWNTRLSREEIMQRMRLLKPVQQFRQDYGYCNSCFLTAGQVIPVVTGKKWETFVQDTLITPLNMSSTLVLSTGIADKPDAARPYTTSYTGTLQRVPFDNWNNLAPAAAIISNVSDLSHWLLMQLDSGKYQGRQVVPFPVLQRTRELNIILRSTRSAVYPTHVVAYALGLEGADYNGRMVYWHTGGAGGMVSNVCFVPEENLGIAILTNNDNQSFFELLRYQLLDAYLNVPYVNRSRQALPDFRKEEAGQLREIAGWKRRVTGAAPGLPLAAYQGTYRNELYGNILVKAGTGHQLQMDFQTKPDLHASLDYIGEGEWLMQYDNIEYGIFSIRFSISGGKVQSVTTRQNEFVEYDPYTFRKVDK